MGIEHQGAAHVRRRDSADGEVHFNALPVGDRDAQIGCGLESVAAPGNAYPSAAVAERAVVAHAHIGRPAARTAVHDAIARVHDAERFPAVQSPLLDLELARISPGVRDLDDDGPAGSALHHDVACQVVHGHPIAGEFVRLHLGRCLGSPESGHSHGDNR